MDTTLIAAIAFLAVSGLSTAAVKGARAKANIVVDNPYWMPMVWMAMPFLTIGIALGVVSTLFRAVFECLTGHGEDVHAAHHLRLAQLAAARGDTGSATALEALA